MAPKLQSLINIIMEDFQDHSEPVQSDHPMVEEEQHCSIEEEVAGNGDAPY
jgi:hypothetical protein